MTAKTVMLTSKQKAMEVNSLTLRTITAISTAGGGARNLIVWALQAHKLGYTTLQVYAPKAETTKLNLMLIKAIKQANELLNPFGLKVERY